MVRRRGARCETEAPQVTRPLKTRSHLKLVRLLRALTEHTTYMHAPCACHCPGHNTHAMLLQLAHAHARTMYMPMSQGSEISLSLESTGSCAQARMSGGEGSGLPRASRQRQGARSNRNPSTWYSSAHLG